MNKALKEKKRVHAEKMKQKQIDNIYTKAVCRSCQIFMLLAYASLSDEFGFGMKRLGRFRERMDRYSVFLRDEAITEEEMIEILAKEGIDVSKVGRQEE